MPTSVWAAMTQLYLCEEPYWSKYDRSEICPHALQINVISDGKDFKEGGRGRSTKRASLRRVLTDITALSYSTEERLAGDF